MKSYMVMPLLIHTSKFLVPYVFFQLWNTIEINLPQGYPYGKKAYKVYDLTTQKVFSSRDIHFYENYFPFHHITASSSGSPLPSPIFLSYDDGDTLSDFFLFFVFPL